jgi:sensor c-di-GMP phosphodiesterase-like protein
MRRKLIAQAGMLLLCSAIGAGISGLVARPVRLRSGQRELREYADRLIRNNERLRNEDAVALETVAQDNLPFCSDREIAFMRDYVFRSRDIRDIGRIRDGKLYCTTGIGRIVPPVAIPKPDMTMSNGVEIDVDVPLMISPHSTGFVVIWKGISVVFNTEILRHLAEPPMYYRTMLREKRSSRALQVFGSAIPLSEGEVLDGRLVERNGVFYQPVCSPVSEVCEVAIESRKDLVAHQRRLLEMFLLSGALLGALLGLIVVLVRNKHLSLENQLRRAVREGLLTLVYQPVVSLETGAIVAAETLVRWINEDGELVRPDVFIALAEGRGFVNEITQMVLRKVVVELGDVLAAGRLQVTINITAQDLAKPEFAEQLQENIGTAGIKPERIGLELTERSTANEETVLEALAKLKGMGYRVYIDDFGTGYSSLAYLHQMQIDAIKVDQRFTRTVGTGAVTASVVPQILAMAEKLKLQVVVEGIETEEQAAYFRDAGRDILGQGWLFGKPVPVAQFRRMLLG